MIYLGIKDKFLLGENIVSTRMSYLNIEHNKFQSQNKESFSPFNNQENHT